eukprot:GHRR01005701.1.p1 GENE.GHRR01005701.1~~GHRR01005701.1.p1  ORF type:complete len:484 (+),score=198.89 GHRR01005701.1:556-2007(+)
MESPSIPGQHDGADGAMYKEMRAALAEFDANNSLPKQAPSRYRAFYAALHSVLGQILQESTGTDRHTQLVAAHQWFVKHKPRAKPADPDMAAAMAASLSITDAANITAAGELQYGSSTDIQAAGTHSNKHTTSSTRQQHHAPPFRVYGSPRPLFSNFKQDSGQGAMYTDAIAAARPHHATGTDAAGDRSEAVDAVPEHSSNQQGNSSSSQPTAMVRAGMLGHASKLTASSTAISQHGCNGAIGTPGVIPVGHLPSKRFATLSSSDSQFAGEATISLPDYHSNNPEKGESSQDSSSYAVSRVQWQRMNAAQQRIELEVAVQMKEYARHRARLEEEISRRQEFNRVAAAQPVAQPAWGPPSSKLQQQQQPGGRALVHIDSQHEPSKVSAYQPGVAVGVGAQQAVLLPADKVKEAKKQLLQATQAECAEVVQQLSWLGGDVARAVNHALLPLQDQPYMTCMAKLPKPGLPDCGVVSSIETCKVGKT